MTDHPRRRRLDTIEPVLRDDVSPPGPAHTAAALRAAAAVAYVGAITAATAAHELVAAGTVALAIPVIVALTTIADHLTRGGRIR